MDKQKKIMLLPVLVLILIILGIIFVKQNLKYLINLKDNIDKNYTTEKIKIITSIFPISDIAKNIAGNKIEVITILKPGASPHTFNPKPSFFKQTKSAKIIFYIGNGLDDWVSDIAKPFNISKVKLDKGINLKKSKKNIINPHYWLSVENAKIIAKNIKENLQNIDSKNSQLYEENYQKYLQKLNNLKLEINNILKSSKNKNLFVFHNSWQYFSDEFGLEISAIYQNIDGVEPNSKHLKEIYNIIKKKNIKYIFLGPQISKEKVKTISKDLNLEVKILDPLGGAEGRKSYIDLMLFNAKQIK